METPYSRNPYQIRIRKRNKSSKTLLFEIVEKKEEETLQQRQGSYWGYRFESVCTESDHLPVNPNAEFCSVVRVGFNEIRFGSFSFSRTELYWEQRLIVTRFLVRFLLLQ